VRVAARHAATPAQALFRALTQLGCVPLTGTSSELHMRQDLAIFDFELESAELRQLTDRFEEP
jgi:diketogulonate reductase-like aldo/keto reductase